MKKRGIGVATGFYGTAGMGGGDPSGAIIKIRPSHNGSHILRRVTIRTSIRCPFQPRRRPE